MENRGRDFFNQLAGTWDELRSVDSKKLNRLVSMIGLAEGDAVLDAGCGTGVLVPFVRAAVGENGRIIAVDFSVNMIARAAVKYGNWGNVTFLACDIGHYRPGPIFDKVVCLNFFPHVTDKKQFAVDMRALLKEGGRLVIMHDLSRAKVNAIHGGSQTVKNDRLPASGEVVKLLTEAGYHAETEIDNGELYFIKARKSPVVC